MLNAIYHFHLWLKQNTISKWKRSPGSTFWMPSVLYVISSELEKFALVFHTERRTRTISASNSGYPQHSGQRGVLVITMASKHICQ